MGKEDNICPKVKQQETRIRQMEDLNDEIHQRSLLGSFIITSKANDDLESLIVPEKELKEPLVDHVKTLCLTKLNVTLPEQEIRSCHYLPDGSIKLTLCNLGLNSAFQSMHYAFSKKEDQKCPTLNSCFFTDFHRKIVKFFTKLS